MFRARDLLGSVAMNRQKNATFFDAPLVSLRFVLGDAHAHEGANQTADGAADAEAGESGHDRTGRNERTESGNRENADPGQ